VTPESYSEDELVERPTMRLLAKLGYDLVDGYSERLGPDGLGRDDQSEVVLRHRLRRKLPELNPDVPAQALDAAIEELIRDRSTLDPTHASRAVYEMLRNGVTVTIADETGARSIETVRLLDWNEPNANEYLAVRQLWVIGPLHTRRSDIVCFVNGIPLVLLELKASHKTVRQAFDRNLRDYRDTIPQLFVPNAFVVLSNASETKVGASLAPWERFGEWKRIDDEAEPGVVSLDTAIHGLLQPARLLDVVENFIAYLARPGGLLKVLAQNHQVLGVNAAIRALADPGARNGKLGVFWHTQGSGKSLSMLFFTQKVLRRQPGNWTFVMVTDRAELDNQLYEEFKDAGVVEGHLQAENSAHLRRLLGEDHRYVFTLIHKFRPPEGQEMPISSDREDVIVITDEAHRSQYSTLALNMRRALPRAGFLGFTGTPLIKGEVERTREVFGEYVSTYNFRDSIEDGATVPLFYENRIPELQIINESFDEEMTAILEAAEFDDSQERALSRRFATEYQLITRPERLQRIAVDLVRHFVARGFLGKGMFVAVDKATAVRMYDLVAAAWKEHLEELRERARRLPELERIGVEEQIAFMEKTEMAVVVSQSQNEIGEMKAQGLDIRPHRARINDEDLGERFKDPRDPFRLVFVCAMWMTGFDVPSCSTIYLDRPIRNHSLMQTIARANRVFPEKENGLIVDYVGVFRHLETALAVYAAARGTEGDLDIIREKSALIRELEDELGELITFSTRWDVDLQALSAAEGFEYVALRNAAVEALLIDDVTRRSYLQRSDAVRRLFAAILPDPAAMTHARVVGVARNIAEAIRALDPRPDLSSVAGAVEELLDRSVGAEEYVIRAAAEGADPEPLIDLNAIDFETLAARVAGRKRSSVQRIIGELGGKVDAAAERNPTRKRLVEELRGLIERYNTGSLNVDEMLRRLQALSRELSDEEQRTARAGLSESELAVFDLLTRPDPPLSDEELELVKGVARKLMAHIQDRLVLDWRRKAETREAARGLVKDVLDELPEAYDEETWNRKAGIVFDHIFASFYDDGGSVYQTHESAAAAVAAPPPTPHSSTVDVEKVTAAVVEEIKDDPSFAERVAEQLRGKAGYFAVPSAELIAADEKFDVEFKSTARWSLRDERRDKRMEDAIVKTVAGFLNTNGGTLFIGVADDASVIGLDRDLLHVKPSNADGFVNWLTTHLIGAISKPAVMRTRARIDQLDGRDVCRVDVAASSSPVMARLSGGEAVFWVRMNNSTRDLNERETAVYVRDHWPDGRGPMLGPDQGMGF
jgi:type I restriction enzyme R subunit